MSATVCVNNIKLRSHFILLLSAKYLHTTILSLEIKVSLQQWVDWPGSESWVDYSRTTRIALPVTVWNMTLRLSKAFPPLFFMSSL